MSTNNTTTTTTTTTPFHETDDLALYFDAVKNGDIYDKKTNELICTSGNQHIVVRGRGSIHEDVESAYPCFDGTLIRAFYHNQKWQLATRKKINAFDSHWSESLSFGELFENISKTPVEYLIYSLDENFAYSFLLLSPNVTNVLFNPVAELLFVSAFDRKKQIWEQIQGDSFPTIICPRPPFAKQVVKSDALPHFSPDLPIPKTEEDMRVNAKNVFEKSLKNPERNQRGLLFIGKSGRLYRQDFQKYRNWQRIINDKPLHVVFFEQMKKYVKKDASNVLFEFYQHYHSFQSKGILFEQCVCLLRYYFEETDIILPSLPSHLETLFLAIRSRNNLRIPTFDFIRRTLAFQKYTFLTEWLFHKEGEESRKFIHENQSMLCRNAYPPQFTQENPQIGKGMDCESKGDEDGGVVAIPPSGEDDSGGKGEDDSGGKEPSGEDEREGVDEREGLDEGS